MTKTQLIAIALAADLKNPIAVVAGIILAFSVIAGVGIVLESEIVKLLPARYLKIGTSLLFLLFGLVFILGATTGAV